MSREDRIVGLREVAAEPRRTKIVKRYLHGDSDEFSGLWEQPDSGDQEAWKRFTERESLFERALYEVDFDLEVDLETGRTEIIRVNGRELRD